MLVRLTFLFFAMITVATTAQPGRSGQVVDGTPVLPKEETKKSRNGKGSIFLNDSARNVYGPNTTLSITEKDLFYNRVHYTPLDTSIINIHRWGYLQRFNYLYQDLGNIGTALNPIYPVVRNFAGALSGFNAYRLYFDTEAPRYYDTKSPYAKINVIWGGAGRAMTHIEFSRNINSRWNFGFNYRPILVDKQLQRQRRGDRQVVAHYYDFHTSYKSKDEKYLVLFNFRRTRHRVFENGGVLLKDTADFNAYFDKEASPRLVAAESSQLLRNYHLFNQYSFAKGFQVYNTTDWNRESNNFADNASSESVDGLQLFDHWERVRKDTLKINDIFRFSTFQTEVGLKGRVGSLFYNGYYKVRNYSTYFNNAYDRRALPVQGVDGSPVSKQVTYQNYLGTGFASKGTEYYIGGRVALEFDSLIRLSGTGEINQNGNYSIDGKFSSKLVDASFLQSISRPAFLYNQYWGSHDFWNNSFKNITGLKMEAFLKTPFKRFLVAPGLSYTLLNNYVYFKKDDFGQQQTVLPVQTESIINVANPQLKLRMDLTNKIKLGGSVINNVILSDPDSALQIPNWLATGQLALEDNWFKKNLLVQVGMDVTWRSAYKAMGYDIAIQQYYVQHDEVVNSALIADLFFNAKMKRGRLFIKYHNFLQVIRQTGYLETPGYPGQRNVLDFGFELLLFD